VEDNEEIDERMLDQSTPLGDGIVDNDTTCLGNAPVVVGSCFGWINNVSRPSSSSIHQSSGTRAHILFIFSQHPL
jgi:hypothetical protein